MDDFRRFHNALRILMNIDFDEFEDALLTHTDLDGPSTAAHWQIFRNDPHRWFIAVPTDLAKAIWKIVESRQPRERDDG